MKCNECGHETEQVFSYCPKCGAGPVPALVTENPAAVKILTVLQDKLFLILCILVSAGCVFSLAADGLPLLQILATVFLWLTYAQSKKGIADPGHLRCISGTVYAHYVITYVSAGLVLVVGLIFAVFFGPLATTSFDYFELLPFEFRDLRVSIAELTVLMGAAGGILLFVILAFAAGLITVLNIFSMRYIHGFVKSVYQSIQNGVLELKYINQAQTWLFILGGFSGISALSSLASDFTVALSNGTICGSYILAGVLIRKYLQTDN